MQNMGTWNSTMAFWLLFCFSVFTIDIERDRGKITST
jgi:hypothetical protein